MICSATIKTGINAGSKCKYKAIKSTNYCGKHSNTHKTHKNKQLTSTNKISLVHIDEPLVHIDEPLVHIDEPLVHIDEPLVHIDEPLVHIDEPQITNYIIKGQKSKYLKIHRLCLLQICLYRYIKKIKSLKSIIYNTLEINYYSIFHVFTKTSKAENDISNKKRELIIGSILNDCIPIDYFKYSNKWKKFKYNIVECLTSLYNKKYPNTSISNINCKHKGGRNSNYDFIITINDIEYKIEFKFNVYNIEQTPQFVSPMKPSQYLSISYEEYYYDNYISKLSQICDIPIPNRDVYLKQIHSPTPSCMSKFKTKYKNDKYGDKIRDLSKESIKYFIQKSKLDIQKLSLYLQSTQNDKVYLLYKNNKFHIQHINMNDYIIKTYTKTYNSYIATTLSNKNLKILLRWKNGNGIAFPAFQISLIKNHK
jgi:hypothetical protein